MGDFISAGGGTGTVEEVGLFVTTSDMPGHLRTFVGNNKLFSDRRVDLTAQISGAADPKAGTAALQARIRQIPNVLKKPAPDVAIATFTPVGPVLVVRPLHRQR